VFNNIYHNNYMFRPLMLAIIRLFDMNTYQLVIQVYGLLGGGGGSESARSRIIKKGAWTGVCAVGNMLEYIYC
jgi:hypothetical protein